jgi:hypothetical protein
MNPAQLIRDLDGALAEVGQDVILRTGNTTEGQVTVRAFVRGYEPSELIGLIKQGDKKVTVSPTGLGGFGEPRENQFVVVDGKPRAIQGEPEFIRVDSVLVRINMTVRG